jgi:F-type H+-transporting ATPase subunit delta
VKRAEFTAAHRYARALLEVAFSSAEGDPAGLRRQLEEAAALLEAQEDLGALLSSPAVAPEAKKRVAEAVWSHASPLLRRLIGLLLDRGRVPLLPAITAAFAELWNAARGVAPAEATSAVPLTPEQRTAVEGALGRLTGRDVELRALVDPQVMGGLLVRIEGQVYDGTVRGRLRALRQRLSAAD